MAELLLANHADVNAKDKNDIRPLSIAAHQGHKVVVELLLASKAEVNARDNFGTTPLHQAAHEGKKDVAELLRSCGKSKSTPKVPPNSGNNSIFARLSSCVCNVRRL